MKVRTSTVTIDEYGVSDTVPIDCVTYLSNARTKNRYDETPHEAKQANNV